MTSELLIVKIQSLLASDNGENQAQKRAIAMEYCNQCTQAHDLLEHCSAMIKAGREYSALEFAESCNLLERINTLSFKEEKLWAEFCANSGLPFPMPFDENLIEIVSSLYQKGISQTHPLYRDYRRAMRLRDFDKALAIITTISKINATDEVAKEECQRLRKSVVDRKLKRLGELLNTPYLDDSSEIESICAFLERNNDYVHGKPEWELALKKRATIAEENLYEKVSNIIARMRCLKAPDDLDEIVSLLGELNSMPESLKFSPIDEEFIENVSKIAMQLQAEKLSKEKSQRATALIANELNNKNAKVSKERLILLRKLRVDAGSGLPPETVKILDAEISKLKVSLFIKRFSIAMASMAIVSVLCYVGYVVCIDTLHKIQKGRLEKALVQIEMIEDPSAMLSSVEDVFKKYGLYLDDPVLNGRFQQLKSQAQARVQTVARLKKMLEFVEKTDYAKATSRVCSEALDSIDKVSEEIILLPESAKAEIVSRLDKIKENVASQIENRKLETSSRIRKLLAEYEELLSQYESFSFDRIMLDKRYNVLVSELRSFMEDTRSLFKPHQIDIDKYNDISVRIGDAKQKYADFDDARKSLMSAKSFEEYIAIAKLLKQKPFVPADFYKKLTKIMAQASAIKMGQLAEFAEASAIESAMRVGEFSRMIIKLPPLLGDVYNYTRENGKIIYSLGAAIEKENKWSSGSETMQRVNEIRNNGSTNYVLYRKHQVLGKIATGEKLSNGGLSEESKFAKKIVDIAAEESMLSALEFIVSSNANPLMKLILENYLFEQMRKDPIFSGLLYSKTALAREILVKKYVRGFSFHSWLFENGPRKNFIEKELYSCPLPDLKKEAKICINSIIIAQQNPLKMIGVVRENGMKSVFADSVGAVWAVDKTGSFGRIADSMDVMGPAAELSPILAEIKSSKKIKDEATLMLK
ncbi:MAG: hypothetical protein J6B07_05750 [Opitutales bacterium]|nr:hypothetical protein [Opitutales bacterium]